LVLFSKWIFHKLALLHPCKCLLEAQAPLEDLLTSTQQLVLLSKSPWACSYRMVLRADQLKARFLFNKVSFLTQFTLLPHLPLENQWLWWPLLKLKTLSKSHYLIQLMVSNQLSPRS
jgi:hypothetical protein